MLFFQADVTNQTAGENVLTRVLWSSLNEEQMRYAGKLGYEQATWDHPDAPHRPFQGELSLTWNNCLKESSSYLFTQMVALVVLLVLTLSEVRHFFVLIRLVPGFSCGVALLFAVAFFAYCVIPTVVMMASMLVILEAGNELDVMKVLTPP